MRVITPFFSIESLRPVLDEPVHGAPNDSTQPAALKDKMKAHREWLGLHEGENRIALLGKPIPRNRPMRVKTDLKVLFSSILIE